MWEDLGRKFGLEHVCSVDLWKPVKSATNAPISQLLCEQHHANCFWNTFADRHCNFVMKIIRTLYVEWFAYI
jgi:hypothetical protein